MERDSKGRFKKIDQEDRIDYEESYLNRAPSTKFMLILFGLLMFIMMLGANPYDKLRTGACVRLCKKDDFGGGPSDGGNGAGKDDKTEKCKGDDSSGKSLWG